MKREIQNIERTLKTGLIYAKGYKNPIRIIYLDKLKVYRVYSYYGTIKEYKRLDHALRKFNECWVYAQNDLNRKEQGINLSKRKPVQEMRIDITLQGEQKERFENVKKMFHQATSKKTIVKLLDTVEELNELQKKQKKIEADLRYYDEIFNNLRRAKKSKEDINRILFGSQLE